MFGGSTTEAVNTSSRLILPAALHWHNVLELGSEVNCGNWFSWETVHQKRMAHKENHIRGEKYIFKALNQIKSLYVLFLQYSLSI